MIVVQAARTVEPRRRLSGTVAEVIAEIEAAGGRALGVRLYLQGRAAVCAIGAIMLAARKRPTVQPWAQGIILPK